MDLYFIISPLYFFFSSFFLDFYVLVWVLQEADARIEVNLREMRETDPGRP